MTPYRSYLSSHGLEVSFRSTGDVGAVRANYGVPPALASCHTVVYEDYVVEGHVPMPVLERLIANRPDIAGVALPGMPAGSPGMGGAADGPLVGYSFRRDGQVAQYVAA